METITSLDEGSGTMSQRHLKAALPQIQRLFAAGSNIGVSDGVLLKRYWAGGDESAFETLVARHGPMVLAVCRGVLRDEPTAEDAFQAVFLILVRKARSIRVEDSLGGWLHGVAYRVARRASADLARRRAREGAGLVDLDPEAPRQAVADPRLAALHEEIARLPEPHRQALVSCWLEGKTQTEAAEEIGCGEATVRRRLAGARERLQARLRGKGFDTVAPAPLLAAVPARLLEATAHAVRGPLSTLAAEVLREMARMHGMKILAGVVVVGLSVSGLALAMAGRKGPVPEAPAAPPAVVRVDPPAVLPVADAVVVDEPAKKDEIDPDDKNGWGKVEVPGRVVDPDGKPVAGAKIFVRHWQLKSPDSKGTTDAQGRFTFQSPRKLGPKRAPGAPAKVSRTTTLPGGITITITESENNMGSPHTDEDEIKSIKPWIVAAAPGYGFGTLSPGDSVTIKLTRDVPVTGRVVDVDGRALAGARVRVRDVSWPRRADDPLNALQDRHGQRELPPIPKGEGLDPWLAAVGRAADMNEYYRASELLIGLIEDGSLGDKPSVHAPLIPSVATDAQGRFTLPGIGAERVAELYIDGVPDRASSLIVVATRPLEKPIYVSDHSRGVRKMMSGLVPDVAIYGSRVETVLGPGRTIEGVVVDRETKAPIVGAKIIGPTVTRLEYPGFDRFFAKTDERGHYRIDGFPVKEKAEFVVEVPKALPHFGRRVDLDVKAGTGPLTQDFPLAKGVWITGRVVDDATGRGVDTSVEYHVFSDNPHLRKDLKAGFDPIFGPDHSSEYSDQDGKFRIRGYAGRGIVTAGGGHDYLEGIGADKIPGLTRDNAYEVFHDVRGFHPSIRNTTILVDVPEGVETFECEVRLKKGKARVVRVVGPDGKPRENIQASGLANQIQNPISEVEKSFFPVTNLFPGERREVIARIVSEKLTGMAVVDEKEDGPLTLTLAPWATVKGRLVDDQGKPRSSGLIVQLEDGKLPIHTLNGRNYDKEEFTIDPDGRFRLEGLVPGATYRLEVIEGGIMALGDLTKDFQLQPGENRDLGDVRVMK